MSALTDEMLATLAQTGDGRAADELMGRYERSATGAATQFYLPGGEDDDARQEARIGLLRAIREYDVEIGVPFAGYARLVIRRQLVTSLQAARRNKHQPLTNSVRHATDDEGVTVEAVVSIEDRGADILRMLENRETLQELTSVVSELTPLERHWLTVVINGGEYALKRRGCRNKSAENAVDRARAKIRRRLAA